MRLSSIAMSAIDALGWEEEQVALATLTSTSTSIDFSHGNDDDEVSNMDTDSGHDSDSDFDNDSSNGEAEEDEEEDSPFNVAEYSPIKREEILKTPIISTSNANINKRGNRDCRKSHQSYVNIHIDRGDSNHDNNGSNSNNNSNTDNNEKQYPLSHLKPFFDVGTAVYGPWWPQERQICCDEWFPGKIVSYKEFPSSSPYGPRRKYTIHYDDGDILEDVEDHYVFSKEDYLVLFRRQVGIRCELDTNYADDLWASLVGFYVVKLDGVDVKFARFVDAMDAYDNHIIQLKGESIRKKDLNRPEKYQELFASSSAKKTTKPPQCASSTRKPRSSLPPELLSSSSSSPASSAAVAAAASSSPTTSSPNRLPPGFSSSESESEAQPTNRRCGPRHKSSLLSSSSSSVSSPTLKPTSRDRPERTSTESVTKRRGRRPKSKMSLSSSALLSSSTPTPESTTTPRNQRRKNNKSPPSEVSTASVVTPKTVSVPRKRQKKSLPSKYHGVSYSKIDKKYEAQIEYKNIFHSLGLYKFEADAALAYDMGCKLLWNRTAAVAAAAKAAAASPSLHAVAQSDPHSYPATSFRWKESYEEAIQEEMTNANRKRINVESSYHKVSKSVEAFVSKILFAAEEEKLRSLLDNDKSGNDYGNASAAQFDFTISTPPSIVATETSVDNNDIETNGTKFRLLRDEENSAPTSQRKRKSGSVDEALADTNDNQGDIHASAEFEPAISSPPTVSSGAIVDSNDFESNGTSRLLLHDEDSSDPSSQHNKKSGNVNEELEGTIDDVDSDTSAEFELTTSELPATAMYTTDDSIDVKPNGTTSTPRLDGDISASTSQRKEKVGNDDEELEGTNDYDDVDDTSDEFEFTLSPTTARKTTSAESNASKANGTSRQLFRDEDNNALAKKYAKFLHPLTGSAFLEYYKKSIREILTGEPSMNNLHAQKGDEVLGNGTNGQCHDEHEEDEDDDCSLFSDGCGGKSDDDDNCSLFSDGCGGEDSEDDDCSLFSDSSHMTPQGCL